MQDTVQGPNQAQGSTQPQPQVTGPTDAACTVRVAAVPRLNLADFQNSVPALGELAIVNDGDTVLQQLELTVVSEPPFLKPRSWHLDAVGPGQVFHLTDRDVQLDGALLSRLTEAEKATVAFTLRTKAAPDTPIATREVVVELLPRNQWGGIGQLPEMVTAFVQPNDPAVERVLKAAAEVLRQAGKSGAIDGYKEGPKRAWELASAIWSAVVALGLDYSLPPASFEHQGQKVRGPSQIAESGLGTCLDLALLFAAALEQAHLNPVLVFTQGHAFTGVWLKSEEFSTAVVDDVTALRKRIKLKELVLFETTVVTHRPAASFSQACELGTRHLAEEQEDQFELAVDVRRARRARIKPLALAEAVPAVPVEAAPSEPTAPAFEEAPDLPQDDAAEAPAAELDPKDRLARWQRKLLDLSLRNALLNFKAGKKSLQLEAPDPGALEDLIAEGQSLKLLPQPELMEGSDPRSQQLHEAREREDLRRAHARDGLLRREVFIRLGKDEMEARLVDLFRSARNALQEGGANTLFLALGFLVWTRDDRPGQRYKAPLILLPVALGRRSARSGFTLGLHDDEPRFNPTLLEMLRQDFKLDIGVSDRELPRDESGLDVTGIWRRVAHAIKDIKGWEVSEEVMLSSFSFAKYLMWKDLAERTEQLRQSPVVKHLLDTPREAYASSIPFPEAHRLDAEYPPQQTFCPLPADSSQLSAVMAAVKGKDFVLIGPPGTGKSQTIANLIAQCLAEGKRVLFVAEKIAALDVVHRRLREVGLGEFCLELHSNKARKLDVLAQLQKAWESSGSIDQSTWQGEAERLKRLRDELSIYVERLHFRYANGWSIFDAIGRVVGGESCTPLRFSWPSASTHGAAQMAAFRDVADRLEVNAAAVGPAHLTGGPLHGVGATEWSPRWQQEAVEAAGSLADAAETLARTGEALAGAAGLPEMPLQRPARDALAALATALPGAAGESWSFLVRTDALQVCTELRAGAELVEAHRKLNAQMSAPWPPELLADLGAALALLEERDRVQSQLGTPWPVDLAEALDQGLGLLEEMARQQQTLSVKYGTQVEQLNVAQLQRDWDKAEKSLWPMSMLGKRKVKAALETAIEGTGEPQVAQDLAALVRIRALRAQVDEIQPGAALEGVWAGVRTRVDFARSAQRAHAALAAARTGQAWDDSGLEAAESGRCGERWVLEVQRLRRLRSLDQQIETRAALAERTDRLWAGQATRRELLQAAIDFERERARVAHSGALTTAHALVAQGVCGARLQRDHERLAQRTELERKLQNFEGLASRTSGLWQRLDTPPPQVARVLAFHGAVENAISGLAGAGLDSAGLREALERLLGERNAQLAPGGSVHGAAAAYLQAWTPLQPAIEALAALCRFDEPCRHDWAQVPVATLVQRSRALVAHQSGLHAWCAWRKAREEAVRLGLSALVGAIEAGAVAGPDIRTAFEVNYCRWWLVATVDNDMVIRTFVSAEHERRVSDFRALDDKFIRITRDWIRARLCAELPALDAVSKNSEWGVLRHEVTKKKKHLPLRELLSRIPSVVLRLTPCLLMSPLSIAQYLGADASNFDLVVFDEASQIPVWDAVGAMARGRQVVMVGDPKQLPPTNFFDRAEGDADDEDVEGDLESILDECLGASLPTRHLSWHYRSRHEGLIAFSNHRYYGGGLVTFPSPVTNDQAVSFHHVHGTYEKGGARVNKPEAKALVADLVARLKSPGFKESKLTIGVVTFNTEQQGLIEDLLDEERRRDPSIEPYFSEAELEPVFVKNLESVQGDERDIMYFSITYGPDTAGAVSMNFGPLNRDGGERRLNVAVTRARHELRIFSSLRGEQMDLSRTQAVGVRDLKHFLEFAERGPRALAEATFGSRGDFESPFEQAVAAALERKGWQVQTQIGASSFRVDLGVVHPDAPGRYLAGVECDGATYHRSATARDRDKLREQVLRGLGWEIVRIWSTDWWIDPQGTLDRVHGQLDALLQADRTSAAAREQATEEARAVEAAIREAAEAEALQAIEKASALAPQDPVRPPDSADETAAVSMVAEPAPLYAGNQAWPPAQTEFVMRPVFVEADPLQAVATDAVDAERFFEGAYDAVLQAMLLHVAQVEGPVHADVLARRIARAHGFQRTGKRIQERVESLAAATLACTEEDIGTFYWPAGTQAGSDIAFRPPGDESNVRGVEEICLPELQTLARAVRATGKSGEDAVSAMAREAGLLRPRASSKARLEKALAGLE